MRSADDVRGQFVEQGYAGPVRLLSIEECRAFLIASDGLNNPPPLDWHKGRAAASRAYFEIATHPAVIEMTTALLGEDVMLWGASMADRPPGAAHPWHSDIETSDPSCRTVSVWIGLQNTTRDSSLLIVPRSHRFGTTIQEVRHTLGIRRDDTADADIAGWAGERDERSSVVALEMTDGDALFFDGRLWHGSHNLSGNMRRALLLQYATPDTVIRIPNLNHLDWPFQPLDEPLPPCVMVSGGDKSGVNRFVQPPPAAEPSEAPGLSSRVCQLRVPLLPDESAGWKPYQLIRGSTANLHGLSCHASVLIKGHRPHSPHRHREEELMLVLAGEADLLLPNLPASTGNQRMRLRPGRFVYYPAHFAHSLETVSNQPANYLMFKWLGDGGAPASVLPFGHFSIDDSEWKAQDGFCPRPIFEGPTAALRKLHCHVSTLTPNAGYEPHVDAHDVAIVVLEGEVETLGVRARPHDVIFSPAGERHGMHNPGATTAKYLVFEFHGRPRLGPNPDKRPIQPSLVVTEHAPRSRSGLKRLWPFSLL